MSFAKVSVLVEFVERFAFIYRFMVIYFTSL